MNTFRKTYRQLTVEELEHVEQIKDAAERLELLIKQYDIANLVNGPDGRMIVLAMTNLEQAVMWAVKAYT